MRDFMTSNTAVAAIALGFVAQPWVRNSGRGTCTGARRVIPCAVYQCSHSVSPAWCTSARCVIHCTVQQCSLHHPQHNITSSGFCPYTAVLESNRHNCNSALSLVPGRMFWRFQAVTAGAAVMMVGAGTVVAAKSLVVGGQLAARLEAAAARAVTVGHGGERGGTGGGTGGHGARGGNGGARGAGHGGARDAGRGARGAGGDGGTGGRGGGTGGHGARLRPQGAGCGGYVQVHWYTMSRKPRLSGECARVHW